MKRMDILRALLSQVNDKDIIISCYSPTCHELYSLEDRDTTFYVRDSMGLPTSIGLGLALTLPERRVIVLEGDGGILMNLGSLATIASLSPKNLFIIILDNESYENTGGQPTATAKGTDIEEIAKGAGLPDSFTVRGIEEFSRLLRKALRSKGPLVIVAKIEMGRADVPPMSLQHIENKYRFIQAISLGSKMKIG